MRHIAPCPFCGEEVKLDCGFYGSIAWVECRSCHAHGPMACRVSEEFIKQWNKVSSRVRDGKMEEAISKCVDEPDHIRRHDAMGELGEMVMKKLSEDRKEKSLFPTGKDGQIFDGGKMKWVNQEDVGLDSGSLWKRDFAEVKEGKEKEDE